MGCWQPLKADSFLALAADFLKKGNKFAVNEQNLLGLARFVKDACQQNEPLKKNKHLGSLSFIPRLFCEYSCICPESTFSRRDFYCYDLNSDCFYKECAGCNVSDRLERSNNSTF